MSNKTKQIVGLGLFTAIVVVLQLLAVVIRPSAFNISLVLIPIVVGAAMYGYKAGAWLGFVFGVVVLLTDASAFLAVNIPGTIITCILKGTLAGLAAGLVYKALEKKSRIVAVFVSAVVCPIVNTGVFLLGCMIFFMDTIKEWSASFGYTNAGAYMILGLVGINFLIEFALNMVLNPVIVKIIDLGKGK